MNAPVSRAWCLLALHLAVPVLAADVNARDKWGYTPLYYAIWNEDKNLTGLLIDKGANVSLTAEKDYPPIYCAVWNEDLDTVKLLVAKGAKFNVTVLDDRSAFRYAVSQGSRDIVEFFVSEGIDIPKLYLSACIGDLARVESLVEQGTDVDTKDELGWTPLYWAASLGRTEVAVFLIAHGASVQVQAEDGSTPLYQAAQAGDHELVTLMLSKGANVRVKTKQGGTPLHSAASTGHRAVAELLIASGADVHAKTQNNWTPLHRAALTGHKDVAEILIANGADVSAKDNQGRTPLSLAEARGYAEVAELLRKQTLVHDVAVTNVSVPSACVRGDIVPIIVSVANEGDQREACHITLVDGLSSVETTGREITLEPRKYKSANAADLILSPPSSGQSEFGWGINIHGDINRDGHADLVVGGGTWNDNRGCVCLYYGDSNMDTDADRIFEGENPQDFFGNSVDLGDVNGDGYDDLVIGAPGCNNKDGRVYIFFGGVDMDKEADVILDGEEGKAGYFSVNCLSTGDIDNDGCADVLVGSYRYDKSRGRAYLYYGGDPMDRSADVIFEGERANDVFGRNAKIGQDIDGDGYRDILIGARTAPDGTRNGRAYLFYGGDRNQMDAVCDMLFTLSVSGVQEFGSSLDIFDIDSDGHADVVIGVREYQQIQGESRGGVFLYWGDERDKMDAGVDVIIPGEDGAQSSLGGDKLFCTDFNRDGYGDIAVGAYNWYHKNHIGRTYIYYGGTKTSIDTQPDMVFTGETEGSLFGHDVGGGDFNNDGYIDLVVGALGYNNKEGRAYVFYGPFLATTDITLNWDTTNASIGKHTLKVEIPPVEGEENTHDNVKTVTVNVKGQ